jgi:hypothetical protein
MTIKELKKIYKECKVTPYRYGGGTCEGTVHINGNTISICGFRDCDPYGKGWGNRGACIIYDDGEYRGRSADVADKAKELILLKLKELKAETIKHKITEMEKDFE